MHDSGVYKHFIGTQVFQYILLKAECETKLTVFMNHAYVHNHKPQGDGILIFNKEKVACQLAWNSRSQTLSGLAMTIEIKRGDWKRRTTFFVSKETIRVVLINTFALK